MSNKIKLENHNWLSMVIKFLFNMIIIILIELNVQEYAICIFDNNIICPQLISLSCYSPFSCCH